MQKLNIIMKKMPQEWRYNWCDAGLCCCLGCCNVSGRLLKLGFTKQDWEQWIKENPKQETEK